MKDNNDALNDLDIAGTPVRENHEENAADKDKEEKTEEQGLKETSGENEKDWTSVEKGGESRETDEDDHPEGGKKKDTGGRGKKAAGKFLEIAIYVLIIFVCVKLVPAYVVQRTIVDGDSMETTLQNNDNLLVEKFSLYFSSPKRFDVVVFYPYGKSGLEKDEAGNSSGLTESEIEEQGAPYYIKRVIGLPGETVQIKGSNIYINGKILKENYGKDPITDAGNIFNEPVKLGDDEFFVLGDNRSISYDSRYIGAVKKKNIRGCAVLRIYPFSKFGIIK